MHSKVDEDSPIHGPAPPLPNGVKALSLRRNFAWTLAGNLVYAACQWGMLVVLAKLGSPQKVGQFALGLAVTAPIIQFSNLQLRGVQATDAREQYQFPVYLAMRLLMTLGAVAVIALVVVAARYPVQTASVIIAIGLAKAFESISDVFYGLMQRHERMDRIAQSMLLKGPLSLVALWAGVKLTGSVFWGSVGLALAWLVVLVAFDIRSGRLILGSVSKLKPLWDWPTLRSLAVMAFPLGIVMTLGSLNTNVPRYFVEHHGGEGELGIYAAITYLMIAGNTVVAALGQSASPRLARHFAAEDFDGFRKLMSLLAVVGVGLGVLGLAVSLLAGPKLLTVLYRPEYAAAAPVFSWAMFAAIFSYVAMFLGYGLIASRRFASQIPLYAVVTSVTALACWLLVPDFGLLGAAWALLAGSVVQSAGGLMILLVGLKASAARSGQLSVP